ncbi:uncharacterized protein LOC111704862 isoform X2 [Eurytemora carolleeae]|uniref:uncharacterized protein LOC111704862 isoform X2 n=1 Tax=Eurytemora carolleeae TaxID=1294199 RepID=UPI000C7786F2|nr:uncharacterized protein LOC111704862 isoform X2 [Eurytemora carolleeae]|eukprot:XP_023332995.1 uncharacterized protein LOC111704862 isoform X2 [Eurytemora affinis]
MIFRKMSSKSFNSRRATNMLYYWRNKKKKLCLKQSLLADQSRSTTGLLTEEKRPLRRVPNLRYDSQEQHESSASDSDNGVGSDSDNGVGSDSDSENTVLDGPPKFTQETMQDSPKRPRMNIETPKSTNCSSEKRLDRYEVTPEKTPDRIVKTPFRSQEKRFKQETIEEDSQVTNAIILREIIKTQDYLKRVEERIKGVEERINRVENRTSIGNDFSSFTERFGFQPASTIEELMTFEKELDDSQFYAKVLNVVNKPRKFAVGETTRHILRLIADDRIWALFNLKGTTTGKFAYGSLCNVDKLIQDTVLAHHGNELGNAKLQHSATLNFFKNKSTALKKSDFPPSPVSQRLVTLDDVGVNELNTERRIASGSQDFANFNTE